ncbi:hypothetical protein DM82_5669 [Burkholderia oklahomensis]|uniref:Uncharacterized protein n=1 Tax=Burkholderia oklahomensis TaxID=342113 RepID=A0AAI8FQW2_9BURK|nr:hypothetical protein DM82_5669 [Burkholderia oklahomensis]AOI38962.1 hypothetical protein WG70_04580 [Burkholderia oklahomensis EO147]KUY65664.1 hypothetical protein WG70_28025 [Burkholderia oklahomensis EO147]
MRKQDDFRPERSGIRGAAPPIPTLQAANRACARQGGNACERIDGSIGSITSIGGHRRERIGTWPAGLVEES